METEASWQPHGEWPKVLRRMRWKRAPRDAVLNPWHSQEKFEGRLLGHRLTWGRKPEGTRACRKSGRHWKACTVPSRKTRAIGWKLDCLNPNLQWWNRTRTATTPGRRCHRKRAVRLLQHVPFVWWTMCSEHMQGDEWGTYVALGRSAPPERGMAYRTRVPRSRSPRSSLGWGKPTTWRRGTGRRHGKGGRVRDAQEPEP